MPGLEHGKICALIARLLGNHVEAHDLGHVMSNDSAVQTGSNPDTVRGGDVIFYSYERLPRGNVPKELGPVAPDLVVEVRSPSDRWNEIMVEAGEYLKAGSGPSSFSTPRPRPPPSIAMTNSNRYSTTATR